MRILYCKLSTVIHINVVHTLYSLRQRARKPETFEHVLFACIMPVIRLTDRNSGIQIIKSWHTSNLQSYYSRKANCKSSSRDQYLGATKLKKKKENDNYH